MSFTVIIPARFHSTRLPGKPLLDIAGKPMIQRVYEAACRSEAREVLLATDDQRIVDAASSFGAKVFMTSADHPSGTDRLQEVCKLAALAEDDLVVNVQGDEPLIDAALINQVASNLGKHEWASIASLCDEIDSAEQLFNPNNVKVVFDRQGAALYFSRAPIPWAREHNRALDMLTSEGGDKRFVFENRLVSKASYFRHIGIYAYRVSFLNQYVQWSPTALEQLECLEQLRALEHGHRIHMAQASAPFSPGVDTEEDLALVRSRFTQMDAR